MEPTKKRSARNRPNTGKVERNAERGSGSAPNINSIFAALGLIAVVVLVYANSLSAALSLDSVGLVLKDPRIREMSLDNLRLILQHTYYWPNGEAGLYRPITILSFLFNYSILGNGPEPWGYHAVNIFLHAANVILLWLLARRITGSDVPSLFIAGLWAVHPLSTEAVTNISGRADLLATFGVLACMLAYLRWREEASWRHSGWLVAALLACGLAVFSKESAVVVPILIVLYELLLGGKPRVGRWYASCAVLLVPVLAMLVARMLVLSASRPAEFPFVDNPLQGAGFLEAKWTALTVIARYLFLVVWPINLSCDYSYAQIPVSIGNAWEWMVAVLAVVAVGGAFMYLYRRNRTGFFFVSFAVLTFLPASNLLFLTGTIMAERLLYLPMAGLIGCGVLVVYSAAQRVENTRLLLVAVCVAGALLSARTWLRNSDWRDERSIVSASLSAGPNSFKLHKQLATLMYDEDSSHANMKDVLGEIEKSLAPLDRLPDAINDGEVYQLAGGYYLVQGELLKRGESGSAEPAYRRALLLLQRSSNIEQARSRSGGNSDLYQLLAATYLRLGDAGQALPYARRALALNPRTAEAYRQIAYTFAEQNLMDDAAVALFKGVLLTRDLSLEKDLTALYSSGSDAACAVVEGPQGPALNRACGVVRKHFCKASAEVIPLLSGPKPEDAQRLNTAAARDYGCESVRKKTD